jgi:hypothetical protein
MLRSHQGRPVAAQSPPQIWVRRGWSLLQKRELKGTQEEVVEALNP